MNKNWCIQNTTSQSSLPKATSTHLSHQQWTSWVILTSSQQAMECYVDKGWGVIHTKEETKVPWSNFMTSPKSQGQRTTFYTCTKGCPRSCLQLDSLECVCKGTRDTAEQVKAPCELPPAINKNSLTILINYYYINNLLLLTVITGVIKCILINIACGKCLLRTAPLSRKRELTT